MKHGHAVAKPSMRRGFTLVELLVVVAIMAILASIGMPLAELSMQRAREEDLRRSLREIRGALDAYKRLTDEGRIERAADGSGYPPDLLALVNGVTDARSPSRAKLYFLRNLPRDPMSADQSVPAERTWDLRSYESSPSEPRPGKDVYDVHSPSQAVGLDGTPYRTW